VIGRVITLDGVAHTVIGVMPSGFLGPTVRNRVGAWALGLGLARLCTHLLSHWLYGVAAPTDIPTFVACVVGMLTVTTVASYLPARRAARIDPGLTLRSE
jgi:ABC-type lipoprotein release transport system permease subunit